jgi:hypothetical protein
MKRAFLTIMFLMTLTALALAEVNVCQVQYLMGVGKTGDRLKVDSLSTASGTFTIGGPVTCDAGAGWSGATSSLVAIASNTLYTAVHGGGGTTGGALETTQVSVATATANTASNTNWIANKLGSGLSVTGSVAVSSIPSITGTITANAGSGWGTSTLAQDSTALSAATSTASIASAMTTANARLLAIASGTLVVSSFGYASESTSFTTAAGSPIYFTPATTLNYNCTKGMIANDGAGNISVSLSFDGTNYMGNMTMKSGEVLPLDGLSVNKVRITYVADSAYRVWCW